MSNTLEEFLEVNAERIQSVQISNVLNFSAVQELVNDLPDGYGLTLAVAIEAEIPRGINPGVEGTGGIFFNNNNLAAVFFAGAGIIDFGLPQPVTGGIELGLVVGEFSDTLGPSVAAEFGAFVGLGFSVPLGSVSEAVTAFAGAVTSGGTATEMIADYLSVAPPGSSVYLTVGNEISIGIEGQYNVSGESLGIAISNILERIGYNPLDGLNLIADGDSEPISVNISASQIAAIAYGALPDFDGDGRWDQNIPFENLPAALADLLGLDGQLGLQGTYAGGTTPLNDIDFLDLTEELENGGYQPSDFDFNIELGSNLPSTTDPHNDGVAGDIGHADADTIAAGGLYPVVIDLDGDGVEISTQQVAEFDADDDGYLERTSWAAADDGFLVLDLAADGSIGTGDGVIDQARELAFGLWGPEGATDLQALAQATDANGDLLFDSNGDGILSGPNENNDPNSGDALWSAFHVWQDANQNGVTDDGELLTLAGLGITSINLTYDDQSGYADTDDDISVFGNTLHGLASFTRNGEVVAGGVGDVSLAYSTQGYRRVETTLGHDIEFETGETFRYAELDGTGSSDVNLAMDWIEGATGDIRDNVLSAFGHVRAVSISGGAGNDVINGGQLDDLLSGDAGADQISGGAGNDVLLIDADDTLINGGSGSDTAIVTGTAGVTLNLTATSIETAYGGDGDDAFTAAGSSYSAHILGGNGNDLLTGSNEGGTLSGDGGNDTVTGQDSGDTLLGGDGNDLLTGQDGDDFILGGAGDDDVSGNAHDDTLFGGDGDDLINGHTGDDYVDGGAGADTLYGGDGDDYIKGGADDDVLYGGTGDDHLLGGWAHDTLTDMYGNNTLDGGDGDDSFYVASAAGLGVVYGGLGDDTLYLGGTAADWVVTYQFKSDWVSTVLLERGFAQYKISNGAATYNIIDVESVHYLGDGTTSALAGVVTDETHLETFYHIQNGWQQAGTVGADLWTSAPVSTANGGIAPHTPGLPDDDLIETLAGADIVYSGIGDDTVNGGNGADIINGEAGHDFLSGQSGDDILLGGVGSDTIHGGTGDDQLSGGDWGDTLYGETGDDVIFGGNGDDVAYGGYGQDYISGDAGDDTIEGGYNRDTLLGGDGNDRLEGGSDGDGLWGDGGNDTLLGQTGNDRLYGGEGQDTLHGGDGFDALSGDAGDDNLNGNADDDYLSGGDGTDTLNGGFGNDIILGGLGADAINGGDGLDFVSFQDIENSVSVHLLNGTATDDVTGDIDTLASIENVIGSEFSDDIQGDATHNVLLGGGGNDAIFGRDGHDILEGGAGNDALFGHNSFDRLSGGDGDDLLDGGLHDDELSGGAGADTYVFVDAFGNDIINDFDITTAGEVIDLSSVASITDWVDLLANHLADVDGKATIDDGQGNTIGIDGLLTANLSEDNFVF